VVDTPGFGDFVNNDDSWKPIIENIEARFDSYLEQENRVNRLKIADNRVHACLYFIQPTIHALKPLDIEFTRRLHTKVNLIPVIAKADTLTDDEVAEFKARILVDIAYHNIHIFQAPTYENEDEESITEAAEIASKIPFAVVGSDQVVIAPGSRKVRGWSYPWGVCSIRNTNHDAQATFTTSHLHRLCIWSDSDLAVTTSCLPTRLTTDVTTTMTATSLATVKLVNTPALASSAMQQDTLNIDCSCSCRNSILTTAMSTAAMQHKRPTSQTAVGDERRQQHHRQHQMQTAAVAASTTAHRRCRADNIILDFWLINLFVVVITNTFFAIRTEM
jgi:hypothetical protein